MLVWNFCGTVASHYSQNSSLWKINKVRRNWNLASVLDIFKQSILELNYALCWRIIQTPLFFEILVSWFGYTLKFGARLIDADLSFHWSLYILKRKWDTVSTTLLNNGLFGYIFENTVYSWVLILLLFDQ